MPIDETLSWFDSAVIRLPPRLLALRRAIAVEIGASLLPIDHLGLLVGDVETVGRSLGEHFGVTPGPLQELPGHGVRVLLVPHPAVDLEVMSPLESAGALARRLTSVGDGFHHLAFSVADLPSAIERAAAAGRTPIDRQPRHGLNRRVAFLHPAACDGVLVELVGD